MSDIVERLRLNEDGADALRDPWVLGDAADEIELLQSVIDVLQVEAWDLQMNGRHYARCRSGVQLTHEQWGAVTRARSTP